MSIHHLEQAAELELHATTKLVFMALCDDASKETRVAHPGMEKLRQWGGVNDRRVHQIIEDLVSRGRVARTAFAYPGRRAEFLVFPTAAEYAAIDEKDPRLNAGHPVDNSSEMGAVGCDPNLNGCNHEPNGCNPDCTPPVSTPLTDLDQVPNATTGDERSPKTATGSAGRDGQGAPSPKSLRSLRGHGISTPDVFASVGHWLAPTHLDDEGLEILGGEIVRKASVRVLNPTAYVVEAIRNPDTRSEWIARAWVIAGELHLKRATGRAV
jgi:hypothetical protein